METRDNEYLIAYWNICDFAKDRILESDVYVEKHHIYPKSIYGKNDITVKLTAQEHFLAHKHLWLGLREKYGNKHPHTRSMANAFRLICTMNGKRLDLTPDEYEKLRIAHAEANKGRKHSDDFKKNQSIRNTGDKNPMFGKNVYSVLVEKYGEIDAKIKYSEMYKKSLQTKIDNGNLYPSDESKEKNRIAHLGKTASEDTIVKLKNIHKNRTNEEYKIIADKALQTKIKNGTLQKSEEAKQKYSHSKLGNKNPMFGKSVYSVWVEKYGEEEAEVRKLASIEKNKKTRELNRLKNGYIL